MARISCSFPPSAASGTIQTRSGSRTGKSVNDWHPEMPRNSSSTSRPGTAGVADRGVDRMWVIVRRRVGDYYVGVLDSDPGIADGLQLKPGTELVFTPEHVVEIGHPPRSYVVETYGNDFFAASPRAADPA